jgi:hypothetical protein
MSAHRARRIDRDTAEQLLRGAPAGSQAGPEALVELLAAAARPPGGRELAGEQAAMAAFRAARPHAVHDAGRGSMLKTALAKMLTVKVAAAAIAISVVGGGVALAASNGALPSTLGSGNSAKQPAHATGQPSPGADKDKNGNAAPSPSLVGLCRAYAAGVADNPGKALENPAFGALISAAGDKDKVTDYCTDLLKDEPDNAASNPGNAPTARPSPKTTPSHPAPPEPAKTGNQRVIPTAPAT